MKLIENIYKVNFSFSNHSFSYEGKNMGRKGRKTYFWYDQKNNKLYYENFSRIQRIIHVVFGYKKQFNRKNLWSFFVEKRITSDPCPSKKHFKTSLVVLEHLWKTKAKETLQAESAHNDAHQHRYDLRMADSLCSDDQIIKSLESELLDPTTLSQAISLSSAVVHGRKELFKYLLLRVVPSQNDLNEALITALHEQHYDSALALLAKGADPSAIAIKEASGEELSLIHLAIEHLPKGEALSAENELLLNELLKSKPNVNTVFRLTTPLMLLCGQGHLKLVKRLVEEHHANVNLSELNYQKTPLFEALKTQHFSICEYLMDQGAEISLSEVKYALNQWMINKTAANKKIMDLLIAKIDLKAKVASGIETPLKMAAERRDKEAIQYLLDHGANINEGEKWESLLSGAIEKQDLAFIQSLHNLGIDLSKGYLLQLAVRKSNIEAINFFLENGVDINTQDMLGKTALHYAAEQGNEKIAFILIAANARLDLKEKSQFQDTAASLAKRNGFHLLAEKLV